jgi:hypothetical protein
MREKYEKVDEALEYKRSEIVREQAEVDTLRARVAEAQGAK